VGLNSLKSLNLTNVYPNNNNNNNNNNNKKNNKVKSKPLELRSRVKITISCLVVIQYQKIAEKIQINLSNDQTKSSDEQFLQAPRNWEKCSAL
jgi:hypothetical protein